MITEQDDDDAFGKEAHVRPKLHGAESNLGSRVLKEHGERSNGCVSEVCEMSENHEVFPPG
jgi:hypothetical protein